MPFSVGDLIAKHNELKSYIEAEEEAHKAALKPYKDGLAQIMAACGVILQEQGLQNFKAEGFGTAYLQHGLSVKVDNREVFLQFVQEGHLDFLDAGVLKDPVRDWIDKTSAPPPGVKAEPFVKCLIRRT